MTVAAETQPKANPFIISILAGVITAIPAIAFTLLVQADQMVLYVLALLLVGTGPVLGYGLATGQLGKDWLPLIGGIIGSIPVLSFLLWPLLVGALSRNYGIGRLYLGSILGFILGIAAFFLAATFIGEGQDPIWMATGFVLLCAVWGGSCGAFMSR